MCKRVIGGWGGGKYERSLLKDTAETDSEEAAKSSWDPAKEEKTWFGLEKKKKISKIINDYLY